MYLLKEIVYNAIDLFFIIDVAYFVSGYLRPAYHISERLKHLHRTVVIGNFHITVV